MESSDDVEVKRIVDEKELDERKDLPPISNTGVCYSGPCRNKGNRVSVQKVTRSQCKTAGGKSWVDDHGTCVNLP